MAGNARSSPGKEHGNERIQNEPHRLASLQSHSPPITTTNETLSYHDLHCIDRRDEHGRHCCHPTEFRLHHRRRLHLPGLGSLRGPSQDSQSQWLSEGGHAILPLLPSRADVLAHTAQPLHWHLSCQIRCLAEPHARLSWHQIDCALFEGRWVPCCLVRQDPHRPEGILPF